MNTEIFRRNISAQPTVRRILYTCVIMLVMGALPSRADDSVAYAAYGQGDYQKAFTLLNERVQDPEPEVYFLLGEMYRRGQGVSQDPVKAISWYEKAAHRGHAAAFYALTEIYDEGEGVKQDYARAQYFAARAAALGYAKAAMYMGEAYARGTNVTQDDPQAYAWFGLASLDGDVIGSLDQARLAPYLSPEDRNAAEQQLIKYVHQRAKRNKELSEAYTGHGSASLPTLSASAPQFIWMAEAEPNTKSTLTPTMMLPALPPAAVKARRSDFGGSTSVAEASGSWPAYGMPAQSPLTSHASAVNQQIHEVVSGETLYSIAREIQQQTQQTLSDVLMTMKRINPTLENDRELKTGERLQIPMLPEPLSLQ